MILSEEEAQDERDDGAPIEVLEQYFGARGWACERTAEGEIVASATGSWAQYELRGVWRPEELRWGTGSSFPYLLLLTPRNRRGHDA